MPASESQIRAVRSQDAVTHCVPPLSHSAAVTALLCPVRVFWGVLTTTEATLKQELELDSGKSYINIL